MVELPRKEVFEAAGEPEVARVTEAPAAPAADVAPAVEAKGKKGRKLIKRTILAAAFLAGAAFVADYGHH